VPSAKIYHELLVGRLFNASWGAILWVVIVAGVMLRPCEVVSGVRDGFPVDN
jgi:hypothetical protein